MQNVGVDWMEEEVEEKEEEEEEDKVGAKTQEKESIWKGFSIQQRKGKHKERNPR